MHSDDGLDEISVCAPTTVLEVRDGQVVGGSRVDPAELGIVAADPASLKGGNVDENLRRMRAILGGEEKSPATDAVALNAGAALYVGGEVTEIGEGYRLAREICRSGVALERLDEWARRSQELSSGG